MTAPTGERLAAVPYYVLHPHGVERGPRFDDLNRIAHVESRLDTLTADGKLEALPESVRGASRTCGEGAR